jgi:hypothetical protein
MKSVELTLLRHEALVCPKKKNQFDYFAVFQQIGRLTSGGGWDESGGF